ncbi:MAG: DUF58 domain-containing protein [bacterium]
MDHAERHKLRYLNPDVIQKIGSLHLAAREIVEGLRVGMHKSPMRGFSTEFVHHRVYSAGDDLRHLDWRVYGRTERYYIKLFEAETNFDANLLLDASSSMRYASGRVSKLDYAKYMAACLAYMIVRQHDSVGLGVFDSVLRKYVEPKGAASVIDDIEAALELARPEPRTNIGLQLNDFALRMKRRGMVMLFSDLFDDLDGFARGLDHLRFSGQGVTVFHIMDPHELTFPFYGTYRFKGLESPEMILTEPRRIRTAYMGELAKFMGAVRDVCARSRTNYVLVDTSKPIDEVLSSFLIGTMRRKP